MHSFGGTPLPPGGRSPRPRGTAALTPGYPGSDPASGFSPDDFSICFWVEFWVIFESVLASVGDLFGMFFASFGCFSLSCEKVVPRRFFDVFEGSHSLADVVLAHTG